jgi:hypothetical protein
MGKHLVHIHALVRILSQQILYEIFSLIFNGNRGREGEFSQFGLYLFISSDILYIFFERRLSEEKLIRKNTQTPSIDLLAVSLIAQLFWRGILQASHHRRPQA